jgi:hypothetical protein
VVNALIVVNLLEYYLWVEADVFQNPEEGFEIWCRS